MGVTPTTITIGHTPDLDDAFMFYAMAHGKIPLDGLQIEHVIQDIQTLNQRSLQGDLDVTAVSAATYPQIADSYWILSVGSSVGQNYGPLVVSTNALNAEELTGKRIAVPGLRTTAFLLLKLAVPDFIPVEMSFEMIPDAVLKEEVEEGIAMHERQLTHRYLVLLPIRDLGTWWQQKTRLPLPLGLNVVKQSLGKPAAMQLAKTLRESILFAMAHQDEAITASMQYGRGIDLVRARQFVSMYVNEETLSLSPKCRKALRLLYQYAYTIGFIPRPIRLTIIQPPTL